MYKILATAFKIVGWIFTALMMIYAIMAGILDVKLVIFVPIWALFAIICRLLMIIFKSLNEKAKSDKM
ncbi:hypothetical protein ACFLT2_11565 [Acidobacteriota bacterium]